MSSIVKENAEKLEVEQKDPLGLWRLPSTDELAGREYSFRILGGGRMDLYIGEEEASFSVWGVDWPEKGEGPVDVCAMRDGVYFIDIDTREPACDGMTVIVLENKGWAMLIHQRRNRPHEPWNRGPDVAQDYRAAAIAGREQSPDAPCLTRDLVGARHFLLCGPKNLYEQIYLNTKCFFGHHVDTTMAKGKAEFHHATYYRLDEDLYLIGWREMDNAAALITVEDYRNNKMTGKAFHPVSESCSVARPVAGNILRFNGKLKYPWDLEPN